MDSHRSNIRPQETDIIIIDHRLYKAAAKGETSAFEQYKDCLHLLLTRGRNTVLHIHLKNRLLLAEKQKSTKFGLEILSKMFTALNNTEKDIDPETKSDKFLKKILEMCPTLLTQQNHIGENPLHVAAKYGDILAVKLLIDQCAKSNIGSSVDHHVDSESGFCGVSKQMLLRMKTKAGDTALHESILMGLKLNKDTDQWWKHQELAEILRKEDHSEVMYDRNAAGETPLYLAVKAGFFYVVKNGLRNIDAQTTSTYYGGYDGKTILHEAVISDFWGIHVILKRGKELCRVADDEKGWVPLHYAANLGNKSAIGTLLECDPFAAGIKDKNGQIPLQVIADPKICRSFIREIIAWSPDCCESLLVDEKFYHDHHAATEFDKITLQDRRIIKYFGRNFMEFEGETKNAFKIWTKAFNDRKKPDEEKSLDKESTLVVAALIATVTFAAGFTLPGGYLSGGDNLPSNAGSQPGAAGSAVLSENAAFKAFLISDAIAMALSSCAVFIHMFLALKKDRTKDSSYFLLAFKLIIVAMVVMVIAFMTGIYAALGSSNAFAIASCVFISVSFLLCILYLTFGYFTDSVYYFLRECAFCILSTFGYIFVRPIVLPIVLAMDYYDDYKNWRRRGQLDKDSQQENSTEYTEQEGDPPPKSNDSRNLETLPESNVNPRTPSINEESAKSLKNANYLEAEKGHDAV
ncbi:ankyrin repeat-containing protein NPR4-like isoform X2 [Ziziphus jujuba]|uniref:Ankyrin repeat-containing protein NPR4-like isoform X2 n=1 Tax=Ziziphus jujuba TaxID=326968 RepID=A0ABM4A3F9_ZIZJJ|nr:ankyrin repeat-containing protein NPR4-like isoform X2 [Ziziphus jujuba]XP_060671269.1 ankyrin repeat-containing protein NPR4-like isoform X2 [Ziziphus jujuba]XP_060671270.1 ankyrin repeat-containing protein NPR4-like isoform X2 [Ziziphus jujuba]XP_060671271.1 ankyrin repeat-containing protein NPR4-like isoform X2 [Ziziphus jujuba]XP_060671272.1 ankyrin repeat-containing protein NPR4-like isoform X2 [Ziziphus jujuba]